MLERLSIQMKILGVELKKNGVVTLEEMPHYNLLQTHLVLESPLSEATIYQAMSELKVRLPQKTKEIDDLKEDLLNYNASMETKNIKPR